MNYNTLEEIKNIKSKYPISLKTRTDEEIECMVESVLRKMTLHEKLGQMYQMVEGANPFGSKLVDRDFENSIRSGETGVVIGIRNCKKAFEYQKIAVEESRLGIPLFLMQILFMVVILYILYP